MLKIYSIFLCLASAATVTNCLILPLLVKQKNSNFIFKKNEEDNKNQVNFASINRYGGKTNQHTHRLTLWGYNGATMSDYGTRSKLYPIRRARLNIFMTSYVYTYFLSEIEGDKQVFINRLVGPEPTSYIARDWMNAQHEIYDQLSQASTAKGLEPTYFYNLFKNWLKSWNGWSKFSNVFTGANLKYNTYKWWGLTEEEAQKEFRQRGVVMQICFYPPKPDSQSKEWNIINMPIIFPNIPQIVGLKQYYREVGLVSWVEPVMPIKVPNPSQEASKMVINCMPEIIKYLVYYLNLSQQLIDDKRVSIDKNSLRESLYYNRYKLTSINLDFWYNHGTTKYISKDVDMYLIAK